MNHYFAMFFCLFAFMASIQDVAVAQFTTSESTANVDELFGLSDNWCECAECCDKIETDRHDFTQAVTVVGKGVAQLEYGYTFLYNDNQTEIEKTHTAPELALRYGLTENIEFKIRWNYVWRFVDAGEDPDDKDAAEDLRLAFKFALTEQREWMPETAVQLRGTVPTGGKAWSTDRIETGIHYIYSWEIAEDWSLAGSSGVDSNGAGDVSLFDAELGETDTFVAWHQSVALGMPLNEKSEVYFEYFGIWSHGLADEFVQNYVNIGLDYLVTCDFVLDFRVGKGLSDDAEDFFCGVGGGYRF